MAVQPGWDSRYQVGGGSVTTAFAAGSWGTFTTGRIAFDGDKIIAAGTGYAPTTGHGEVIMERYNADGTLDTTFGSNGEVVTELGRPIGVGPVTALTVQPNGAILVGGQDSVDLVQLNNDGLPFLARFNANGSLDTTFGPDHSGTEDIGSYDDAVSTSTRPPYMVLDTEIPQRAFMDIGGPVVVTQIALTSDGKILAELTDNGFGYYLSQLSSDGSLDPTYVTHRIPTPSFILQGDGKVLSSVNGPTNAAGNNTTSAIRYNVDGSPDLSFGPNGNATSANVNLFLNSLNSWISDFTVDSNGNIVALGGTWDATKNSGVGGYDITLSRLIGQTPPTNSPEGRTITLYGTASSPNAGYNQAGVSYTWSVTKNGSAFTSQSSNGQLVASIPSFSFTPDDASTYVVTLTVTDQGGGTSSASQTIMATPLTAQTLQATLTSGGTVTLQATTPSEASTIFAAANGLDPATTPTSTLIVDLGGQTVQDTIANVPPQVTLQIINGTFIGGSPALIVQSGQVIVRNSTFSNATNAATILVTGGSLTLRGDTIEESTGYSQSAIAITGGSMDLGTGASPGGNTLNINGSGSFVQNATPTPVAAVGNTFLVNGVVLAPDSLSGIVFTDFNDDGQVDFGEQGIAGVAVALTGTDFLGNAVSMSTTTDSDGAYIFANLQPGTYSITETQPAGYNQGIDTVGTAGGSLAATDQFSVSLAQDASGLNGLNYNFGEQPQASGGVQKGQTASIGFWNNKNGQALIKSFNGGPTSTQLAAWLAETLPHIFGVDAGSNALIHADGTYFTNAEVAARFQQDFVLKGVKLDAQVLATALSVYATNATLDDTGVAANYGFLVSGNGLGTAGVNVGSNGDAFGVANNTVLTVLDLLKATDAQAVEGLLYNGDAVKRKEANSIYSAINDAGNIG